jgi:hypothetical protein
MLALSAWCGTAQDFLKESSKYLVFSKISNAYLGAIDKRSADIHNVQHVIRDMQHQVSQLLRHPDRPSKFMLLYAPELLVAPSFVFSDFLTCTKAKRLVESIKQARTLHAMWSEDDSYAKEALTKKGYYWTRAPYGGNRTLTLGLLTNTSSMRCEPIPRECWVFNFPSKVTALKYIPFFVGPLDMFPWVESLELHWFSDCHTMAPLQNTTTLRKLIVHNGVPYKSLVNSKHITDLVVIKGTLQSDVGKLIHLTCLSLHGHPLMTLPNEVSKLVNLRVLNLTEVREVVPSYIEALVGLEHLSLTWCHVGQVRTSGVASIDFSKFVALRSLHLESNYNLVGDVQLASLNLLYILFRNNHVLLVKPEPKLEGCWCFHHWRAKQIPT